MTKIYLLSAVLNDTEDCMALGIHSELTIPEPASFRAVGNHP
jgi:hypothetical protein